MKQLPISRLSGIGFPALVDAHAAMQLAISYQLEASQWWSAETLRRHQLAQIQALLTHAAATVPYYQALFEQHQVTLPEQLDEAFFSRLPISKRQAIRSAGKAIDTTQLPSDHGSIQHGKTSGSTGQPVHFARTAVTRTFWLAFALRDHFWHMRDFSAKLAAIRWYARGTAEAPEGSHEAHWGMIVAPIFATGPACSLNVSTPLPEQLRWLQREQPEYLVSFPSNILALVHYASEHNLALPAIREIRCIGETVSMAQRDVIESAWPTRVVDIYTCEEAGYLALQCPEVGNYHVQAENILLEIVDDHGQPCATGQLGHVLITTLHNFATPLIRYELGDMAAFGEPCACGRGLPVISRIGGRTRSRLRLPSGESRFPYLGEHGDITRITGVPLHQFQCVQHSLNDIELKLVTDRPFSPDEQAAVSAKMQINLGHAFAIRFSFPTQIERGPSGKFEDFMSLLTDS